MSQSLPALMLPLMSCNSSHLHVSVWGCGLGFIHGTLSSNSSGIIARNFFALYSCKWQQKDTVCKIDAVLYCAEVCKQFAKC